MPRSIRNAGKYKRRASDVDSCLTCQSDLKPTAATVGGRYFATLTHKRLEAQMCLAPRVPNSFRNPLFRVWPWHARLWRRAGIEQRDEGRAGTSPFWVSSHFGLSGSRLRCLFKHKLFIHNLNSRSYRGLCFSFGLLHFHKYIIFKSCNIYSSHRPRSTSVPLLYTCSAPQPHMPWPNGQTLTNSFRKGFGTGGARHV